MVKHVNRETTIKSDFNFEALYTKIPTAPKSTTHPRIHFQQSNLGFVVLIYITQPQHKKENTLEVDADSFLKTTCFV
jgi:hypothetical protein